MTNYLNELEKKYMAAVAEIAAKDTRIAQLEKALAEARGESELPTSIHFTGKEADLLQLLLQKSEAGKEALLDQLYAKSFHATGEIPEQKIVDVFICKLRKKLTPLGIEIETLWGRGWRMTPENKAKVKALVQRERDHAIAIVNGARPPRKPPVNRLMAQSHSSILKG